MCPGSVKAYEEIEIVIYDDSDAAREALQSKKHPKEEDPIKCFTCPVEGCNIWPSGYSHKNKLNNHMQKHHPELADDSIDK